MPQIMGVLNVTPDSFSDGGTHLEPVVAVQAGRRMAEEGAHWIDIGGESTRPGAAPVSEEEELRRVLPVIRGLAGLRVSIDTQKPSVARAAIAAGAQMVNDVGGLRDPEMVTVVAEAGVDVCIMHMQGEPRTMQVEPIYSDVVAEVVTFLQEKADHAIVRGVDPKQIYLDPGIGFGKTTAHNLALIREIGRLVEAGFPVLLGVSRKSFLGRLIGSDSAPAPIEAREPGGIAVHLWAAMQGVRVLRVHDVAATAAALKVFGQVSQR
jgi:dihydropteroate synthase